MTKGRGKVLFVSHDASRTGATLLLFHLLCWLKTNSELPFEILLRQGGELEDDFAALAPTSLLHPETSTRKTAAWKAARRLGSEKTLFTAHRRRVAARIARAGISLVYSNTLTNGEVLDLVARGKRPVVTHVHELESWIRRAGPENLAQVKRHTTRWIACAHAVKANLVANHGIAAADVDVVHEFIPVASRPADPSDDAKRAVRRELGIPDGAPVVGASGTMDWRKGPDLFVHLARILSKRPAGRAAHFVWVGGESPGEPRHQELTQDVAACGLAGRVHFAGPRKNPLDWFAAFDLFAMVSREDPYPLVCLEAASLGKPVLCFDGAGGEPEFVEADCGFVVPYIDVEAMAQRAEMLLLDPALRERLGGRARRKVAERHDLAVTAPRIVGVIERLLRA